MFAAVVERATTSTFGLWHCYEKMLLLLLLLLVLKEVVLKRGLL